MPFAAPKVRKFTRPGHRPWDATEQRLENSKSILNPPKLALCPRNTAEKVMPKKAMPLHPKVKTALGYKTSEPDASILRDWRRRTHHICKPCWELKYCPYGPLVEEFPLLPMLLHEARLDHEYLKSCLACKQLSDGRPLDSKRRKAFTEMVNSFREKAYPTEIPQVIVDSACRVFGHVCPVFFMAEPLTETKALRSHLRTVPRGVMLKVVRRDGQICQSCFEPVSDTEVEFDHVIPFSKGGATTADNLKLVHRKCNRTKGNSLHEILSENPIEHYKKMVKKRKSKKGKE